MAIETAGESEAPSADGTEFGSRLTSARRVSLREAAKLLNRNELTLLRAKAYLGQDWVRGKRRAFRITPGQFAELARHFRRRFEKGISLEEFCRRTGYDRKTIRATAKELGQVWQRAPWLAARQGRPYVLRKRQQQALIAHLGRPCPFTSRRGRPVLRWSIKYDRCQGCRRDPSDPSATNRHKGRGLCVSCWQRDKRERKKQTIRIQSASDTSL